MILRWIANPIQPFGLKRIAHASLPSIRKSFGDGSRKSDDLSGQPHQGEVNRFKRIHNVSLAATGWRSRCR
jgi:hypothetical protein